MASRQRHVGEPAPDYGPDGEEFSVEVHHGGFFCGSRKDRVYLDGKVDEVQGTNGPRLFKHGVTMHYSHCGSSDHNAATCALKKAGEPTVKKSKRSQIDHQDQEAWHEEDHVQEAWHEEEQVQAEIEAMLSQVENPMLSKLQDEASQTLRKTPLTQPLPDSAYIISNLPPARQVHLTTATKGGRTSRSKTGTKKNANTSNKQIVTAKKGQPGH